jgi:hypothetical protein
MLSRKQILKNCGHENSRSFAIDIYQRITNKQETKESLFATTFLNDEFAKDVYKSISETVEETNPAAEDIVLLPPIGFVCIEDGIIKIDDLLMLVMSKRYGVIVPVCTMQPSGTDLLDVLIDLYIMEGIEGMYITRNNISSTVLDMLRK